MEKQVALVPGASGIVGRGLVEYLSKLDGWDVIGLARKPFDDSSGQARFVSVDPLDPTDCRVKLAGLNDVTHIFYAAYSGITGSTIPSVAPDDRKPHSHGPPWECRPQRSASSIQSRSRRTSSPN
jgi:uncharacterized protein YbjT (DUF2867 family)